MKDLELDLLKNAEFKEAFDEFDKVALSHRVVPVRRRHSPNLGSNCNWSTPLTNALFPFPCFVVVLTMKVIIQ